MSTKQSRCVPYAVRSAVGSVAILILAPWASAADPADAGPSPSTANASSSEVLEEVTITGTRIKRRDLESISPLVSIDSEQLESKAGLNLESYLNQLPNYNPAQVPTTGNLDVQPSAVNTVGISTISLRGFGPNRSLVLIDGHRTTPVNALMVTDINGIPAALIDRVEIITGGASAVYGADAIGGVTNFIMKKNFQGAQLDVQDGITQAGDGNELEVSGLMGTNFSEGKGNLVFGVEYYNRNVAYQRNRDFYTRSWSDPNAPQVNGNAFFVQGYNGYASGFADPPSNAALNALWPQRAASPYGSQPGGGVCAFGGCNPFGALYFNSNGSLWTNAGPLSAGSNYLGSTSSAGYGLVNAYNSLQQNSSTAPPPDEVQTLKWNNPLATISEPQTRYAFFANGTYDITDKVQWYSTARFSQSLTTTLLPTPTTGTYGWEAEVPFNAATDSPVNPASVNSSTNAATLSAIAAAFAANPTSNAYTNPGYISPGTKGAQHPVPWQLAMLLLSRGAANGVPGTAFLGPGMGGPVPCNPVIGAAVSINCPGGPSAATSWILDYLPFASAPQRSTVDQSTVFQIETGLRFPLFSDWTGDLYYSRGQSANYGNGYGNDSLQRFRAVIDSPGYGAGQSFIGNSNGADLNFGTSVPATCTSGFYNTLFAGDVRASADCMSAIAAPLQTYTAMEQDIVEANFNGSVMKLPAGDVSAALGFQYRRDSGQFTPDNLQSSYSFLDQTLGLYPLGSLNNEISSRDGYAELFIPLLSGLKFLDKLDLDVGGRYSSFSSDIPNATTFKVNMDAALTKSFRIRGGFNRATRAPNLGELYLGEQEYFGGGANFGDPCSVRSTAPFGAAGAAPDFSASGTPGGTPTKLAGGQSAAGALSTYLICQAQMGGSAPTATGAGTGAAGYYYSQAGGAFSSQSALAAAAAFAWLNEEGNPTLHSETANTWTAGFVFSNLGDNPLISGLSGSVDWWQVDIKNAIELDSPDYANYLCYGTVTVTNAAQAAAQAASSACQNIPRNLGTGGELTSLLTYTNQATIGTAGIDVQINWMAQLADLGLKGIPGSLLFNTQDSFLMYYKTKQSPANFDVNVNWKDSMGPNLAGTNGGAYGYRLFTTLGYVMPSFSANLRWRFLPSVNSYQHAEQQAIIQHNNQVAAAGGTNYLSYIPNTDLAAPAWSMFDLSGSWTINKWLTVRGGINNLFNKEPPISPNPLAAAASKGFPAGTNLNAVCSATAAARGCVNPSTYSLPNDGAGVTAPGFYDVYGRTFFLGFRASF
jgi:iron complex outermembrane recepter protein